MLTTFHKEGIIKKKSFVTAKRIANELNDFLEHEEIAKRLIEANVLYADSKVIQHIVLEKAIELGFRPEKNGMFEIYRNSRLRPDYFKPLGKTDGILIEVERGKTLSNNMDLLDLWKCHICAEANYLFLIIPKLRPRGGEKGMSKVYDKVVNRVSSFFIQSTYINVDAVFIFGY